jgi:hypothetical protein
LSSASATLIGNAAHAKSHPQLANLHGTRPTNIILGFWKASAERDDHEKHAVFGVLSKDDKFRIKIGHETRDGRPMQSNFPSGAGAMWLSLDKCQLENYLEDLSRPELKEYCRVRQHQMDHGLPDDGNDNCKAAINKARARVAADFVKPEPREDPLPSNASGNVSQGRCTDTALEQVAPIREIRQARAPRSTQPPEFRAANRSSAVESRTNNLTVNAVARVEARQAKSDQREAAYIARQRADGGADADTDGQSSFQDSVSRRFRAAKEVRSLRANKEDAMIHMGTRFERKQTGPFEGKLASQGTIISIDGEDYVEYRVLTMPIFI